MVKKLLWTFLIIIMLNPLSSFALDSKSLYLNQDNIYLLLFDEKIEKFETSKDDIIDVSLITTIFNDKHQVILKPKKNEDLNIIFWSNNEVYNFDVFIDNKNQSAKIINISSAQKLELDKFSAEIGEEIDFPPSLKTNFDGFKIDLPPVIKEVK